MEGPSDSSSDDYIMRNVIEDEEHSIDGEDLNAIADDILNNQIVESTDINDYIENSSKPITAAPLRLDSIGMNRRTTYSRIGNPQLSNDSFNKIENTTGQENLMNYLNMFFKQTRESFSQACRDTSSKGSTYKSLSSVAKPCSKTGTLRSQSLSIGNDIDEIYSEKLYEAKREDLYTVNKYINEENANECNPLMNIAQYNDLNERRKTKAQSMGRSAGNEMKALLNKNLSENVKACDDLMAPHVNIGKRRKSGTYSTLSSKTYRDAMAAFDTGFDDNEIIIGDNEDSYELTDAYTFSSFDSIDGKAPEKSFVPKGIIEDGMIEDLFSKEQKEKALLTEDADIKQNQQQSDIPTSTADELNNSNDNKSNMLQMKIDVKHQNMTEHTQQQINESNLQQPIAIKQRSNVNIKKLIKRISTLTIKYINKGLKKSVNTINNLATSENTLFAKVFMKNAVTKNIMKPIYELVVKLIEGANERKKSENYNGWPSAVFPSLMGGNFFYRVFINRAPLMGFFLHLVKYYIMVAAAIKFISILKKMSITFITKFIIPILALLKACSSLMSYFTFFTVHLLIYSAYDYFMLIKKKKALKSKDYKPESISRLQKSANNFILKNNVLFYQTDCMRYVNDISNYEADIFIPPIFRDQPELMKETSEIEEKDSEDSNNLFGVINKFSNLKQPTASKQFLWEVRNLRLDCVKPEFLLKHCYFNTMDIEENSSTSILLKHAAASAFDKITYMFSYLSELIKYSIIMRTFSSISVLYAIIKNEFPKYKKQYLIVFTGLCITLITIINFPTFFLSTWIKTYLKIMLTAGEFLILLCIGKTVFWCLVNWFFNITNIHNAVKRFFKLITDKSKDTITDIRTKSKELYRETYKATADELNKKSKEKLDPIVIEQKKK